MTKPQPVPLMPTPKVRVFFVDWKVFANFTMHIGGKMTIRPLFDKVVVKQIKEVEQQVGGIFLPTAAQDKQEIAVVVAVGEGGVVDGNEIKMVVKPGDKVLYAKFAGNNFKIDGEEVTIIRQQDILAIVEG